MIIGFVGLAGHGKDTAADFMKKALAAIGVPSKRSNFSRPFKNLSKEVFGPDSEDRLKKEAMVRFSDERLENAVDLICQLYVQYRHLAENKVSSYAVRLRARDVLYSLVNKNEGYLSPRLFQQALGTDIFRELVGPDFWANILKEDAHGNNVTKTPYLVSDVRFENEVSVCDLIVHIVRPEYSGLSGGAVAHVSESLAVCLYHFPPKDGTYKGKPYFSIANNGSLEDLEEKVKELAEVIRAKMEVPELIVCAAMCVNSDTRPVIVPCIRHYDTIANNLLDKLDKLGIIKAPIEQGFLTNKGRFVSREEAFKIAAANNQIRRPTFGSDTELYSENIY